MLRISLLSIVLGSLLLDSSALAVEVSCRPDSQQAKFLVGDKDGVAVLTMKFDQPVKEGPTPFVYVQGKFAGAVPGSIIIPVQDSGVVIEIGLPLLREQPLYSFVVSVTNLKQHFTKLVLSSFEFSRPTGDNVWSAVKLMPNEIIDADITEETPGIYTIDLPVRPYQLIAYFWQRRKIDPYNKGWASSILRENNVSFSKGTDHMTFNPTTKTVDTLNNVHAGKPIRWAGAFHFRSPGRFLDRRDWMVSSEPSGAEVARLSGAAGRTMVKVPGVTRDEEEYIIVKMDGYLSCKASQCKKTETNQSVSLFCKLPAK